MILKNGAHYIRTIKLGCLFLLCLALVLWMPPVAANAAEPDAGFCFVQISDTHLGQPGSLKRLARVVERINHLPYPIACVVHTGDVFEKAVSATEVRDKGLRILERLDPPLYAVPGNHDLRLDDFQSDRLAWRKDFSELIHTERVNGVRLVFAYTWPLTKSSGGPEYHLLARLRAVLERTGELPTIVVHHAPCLPELVGGALRGGWEEGPRREWIRLLNRHKVIGVLAGHFHRAELHWLGEVPLFVAPAVAGDHGARGLRVYTYRDGSLSYRTLHVE